MQVAILGLGKMGRNIADKLMEEHHVVVWNRSHEPLEKIRLEKSDAIVNQKLSICRTLSEVRETLSKPRVIWSMLPSGEPTESVLQELNEGLDPGDIIIDGGNAFYKDTEKRYAFYSQKGIKFLGIGVSGGVHGFTNGYPMMIGGDQGGYDYIKPMLDTLAKPHGGHTFFGTGGAGHFVKMVHNGIEYGMMQAIAEGMGVLAKSNYKINLVNAGNNWQRGSIVSSFLMWITVSALIKDPTLSQFDGYIDAKGEGQWTVDTAKEMGIPIPVIEQALEFRKKSQYDQAVQETVVAKLVAAMRHEFGGHEIHKFTREPIENKPTQ